MNYLLTILSLLATASLASATTYDVGPTYAKTHLRDVVWEQLQPGDIVNIHPTPGDYHEVILISQSGTAAQHIVIRGIPDAQGNLPVIDGNAAIMDPNFHSRYNSIKGLGVLIISLNNHTLYGVSPSYIDIETLEIRNGHTPYSYTENGVAHAFSNFVAGIYIEHSHHMAIRGCDLHHNGLGIFANSKYGGLGTSTQDILIERNWLHENGNLGSFREHGSYVESVGAIYQYNIVGPQLAGANATGIKDRSSGAIVRYNTFINVGANYMMMFVDPAYPLQYSRPDYRETFVYGNTFYNTANSGTSLILYGGDQPVYSHYRQGTLHFYANTVVSIGDALPYHSVNIFDLPLKVSTGGAPTNEKLDLRNNIFATLPLTPGAAPMQTYLMNTDVVGTLNLGNNWLTPGTLLSTSTPATITGAANLIYGNSLGANQPGFLNAALRDFRLATGARPIDSAGPLSSAVTTNTLGGDFAPYEEIGPLLSSHPRPLLGLSLDLGAYESDGSTATPGAGALGFAYSTYGQVHYENDGPIAFIVSRLGGTLGAVDLDYTTSNGSALVGSDYILSSGTLHWAAGDASPKTFTVIPISDSVVENQEIFTVTLSNPTNGALLGPSSTIDTSLRDGSSGLGAPATGGALSFAATNYLVSEAVGAAGIQISVTRTGATAGAVSVHYAASNGTASTADYTPTSGTLNWLAGDSTPKTFTVPLVDDALAEPNETILLALSAPTGGAALGNPSTASLLINDNDHTPPPPRELVYAVGASTGSLIAFYSDAPQTPLLTVPITGLPANESVRGIDFEPATGRLYALVMNVGLPVTANHLYLIDPLTGVATLVAPNSFTPLLAHPSCDLGFNPTSGELHIAGGIGQQNLRLSAATGQVLATDTPLAYAPGDPHFGAIPSIVGADFHRLGTGPATYYGIDQTLDTLVRIGDIGGTPHAPSSGLLTTIGALGVDTSGVTGLDFSTTSGGAYACMGGPGATTGDFYYLDLTSGNATLLGQISLPEAVRDIAIAPPYLNWKHTHFTGNVQTPAIASDTADPDADGLPNLLEYALAQDPLSPSATGLPACVLNPSTTTLSLTFLRAAADLTYQVEATPDLTTWTTIATNPGTVSLTTPVTVTDPTPPAPARFLRLRVNQ